MLESVRAVTGGAAPFGPALIENLKKKCEPNDIEFREGTKQELNCMNAIVS